MSFISGVRDKDYGAASGRLMRQMTNGLKELASHIEDLLGGSVLSSSFDYDELTITVKRGDIIRVLQFLHDDPSCRFTQLIDICGVDYPERGERFDVVYHLLSLTQNERIRVKLTTDEQNPVASCIEIYKAADWFEREAFDMYGILFSGHPDLRRLLTDYGFDGYPLRKDFPLTGYTEVRYDDEAKRIVYEPVKLTQEFRTFENLSPWEGPDYVLPGDEKATK